MKAIVGLVWVYLLAVFIQTEDSDSTLDIKSSYQSNDK